MLPFNPTSHADHRLIRFDGEKLTGEWNYVHWYWVMLYFVPVFSFLKLAIRPWCIGLVGIPEQFPLKLLFLLVGTRVSSWGLLVWPIGKMCIECLPSNLQHFTRELRRVVLVLIIIMPSHLRALRCFEEFDARSWPLVAWPHFSTSVVMDWTVV